MKKEKLVSYIATLILSLSAWAGVTLVRHDRAIVSLDEREQSSKALLLEVRHDVKIILSREVK